MVKKKYVDISIIIPLYKGQKYCIRILNMIEDNCRYKCLYQECKVEVIFVNDYPKENIVIENSERLFDIYLFESEKNMGIHASRVKGINCANGEYIIMLDQDDLITEDYLYSQWHKIIYEKSAYCVCNGWSGRFRILYGEGVLEKRINDIRYYLNVGNPICSPGQVIINKCFLPQTWIENIQTCNGADDFLLWLIVLKKGGRFSVNNDYLYYHTPERSLESVNLSGMLRSLEETVKILNELNIAKQEELELLNSQIEGKRWLDTGKIKGEFNGQINASDYLKFNKMFHILLDWMRLKNKGLDISSFCKNNNYHNIAIYGMGYIGEYLYDELVGSDINIQYAIDRTAKDFKRELPIFRIENELDPVDAIIITAVVDTEEIIRSMKAKMNCPVFTISEVLLLLGEN